MAIKKIRTTTSDSRTYEVGGPYILNSPKHGIVKRIVRTSSGAYQVYNSLGGSKFLAPHYVDHDSVVED